MLVVYSVRASSSVHIVYKIYWCSRYIFYTYNIGSEKEKRSNAMETQDSGKPSSAKEVGSNEVNCSSKAGSAKEAVQVM